MLRITDNGNSEYVIIIRKNHSASEKTAAEELAAYLKQITDAEIPVKTDDEKKTDHEIVIGFTNRGGKGKKELGEEGFIFGLPLRHGRGPPFKGDGGLWPVGGMQICLQFGPLALRCKGGYEGAGQSNKYLQAYAFTRQRPQG